MHPLVHSLSFLLSGILNNTSTGTLTLSLNRPTVIICSSAKGANFQQQKIASATLISITKFQKCNNINQFNTITTLKL